MDGFCYPGLNYHYFVLLAFINEIVIGAFGEQFDPPVFVDLSRFKAKSAVIKVKGESIPKGQDRFELNRGLLPYIHSLLANFEIFNLMEFYQFWGMTPKISRLFGGETCPCKY